MGGIRVSGPAARGREQFRMKGNREDLYLSHDRSRYDEA
ncbi:hypothetical protein Deipe_0027 [Deinococcus peraridilitoris DSM 19664]|uniref:Uncharacterized protein n=1 Tax=Deinococcus peraridilitoris (strain DSM 19664 / LMG 22246 / CIP 109416 / KR-200) TaxID=937777 RepID=K9ZXM0_DEIPD|nr:hypothetical protein Deipe_0027 [Deinococcus peraridilitoris DSM 19664]